MDKRHADRIEAPGDKAVIFANGPIPSKDFIRQFLNEYLTDNDLIICADGGANKIAKIGIYPDAIVGDFDSVSIETLKKFEGSHLVRVPNPDHNDLSKALAFAAGKDIKDVLVFGATGGHPDHFLGNLSLLRQFADKINIQYVDEECIIILIVQTLTIEGFTGQKISLWPLTSKAEGVTTSGLKYPLKDETLVQSSRGISNEMTEDSAVVALTSGSIVAIIHHSE